MEIMQTPSSHPQTIPMKATIHSMTGFVLLRVLRKKDKENVAD